VISGFGQRRANPAVAFAFRRDYDIQRPETAVRSPCRKKATSPIRLIFGDLVRQAQLGDAGEHPADSEAQRFTPPIPQSYRNPGGQEGERHLHSHITRTQNRRMLRGSGRTGQLTRGSPDLEGVNERASRFADEKPTRKLRFTMESPLQRQIYALGEHLQNQARCGRRLGVAQAELSGRASENEPPARRGILQEPQGYAPGPAPHASPLRSLTGEAE
jgi:hypothetical protein